MSRHEYPHGLVVEDRVAPADWRAGCVMLLAVFLLAFIFGLSLGLAASRPAEPTAAPEVRASMTDGGNGPSVVAMTPKETTPASASALLASTPRARPTPQQVAQATTIAPDAPERTETGVASHMGSTVGPGYLALPEGAGERVAIRGPRGCIVRTSTDSGPSKAMQRAGRVADLYVGDFERICGPRWLGLCRVSVTYGGSCG